MYHLNKYSNVLIVAYIAAFVAMQIGAQSSIIEGLTSLPIIILVVVWSESLFDSVKKERFLLEKTSFKRDMFIISYSCLIAFITALIFQGNNVDARGWWPFIIILSGAYAIVGGLIFSLLSMLLDKNHSSYTNTFAIIFFLGYFALSLIPIFNLTYLNPNHLFIIFIIILFTVHLLICLGYQLKKRHNP